MLPHSRRTFAVSLLVAFLLAALTRDASAIPAFARKYGLPCSACHEACLIADLSYRLIERPLLRLGRKDSRDPGVTSEQVPVSDASRVPAHPPAR